jgi:transposase
VLGAAAVGAARADTFLGERYRRIARRRGKNRAIVAVGGPDCYAARTNPERKVAQHVRELPALGYTVTLNPAA